MPSVLVPVILALSGVDLSPARDLLLKAIAERAFPGCAVAVGTSAGVIWKEGLGSFDYEGGPSVTVESLYDLASLTKVVGTTSVIQVLAKAGKLSLDDPVSRYLPSFTGGGKETVTLEHLLTHSSGLPAWKPFYLEVKGYDELLSKVLSTPLESPPGAEERYSDLGFILLGEVASRAGGDNLAELETKLVFVPLGLNDTVRNPPVKSWSRVVPTEKRPEVKGASSGEGAAVAVRGVVHDENAAAGEGITGHAGLFSTAGDLSRFAAALLRKDQPFSADLLQRFTARRGIVPRSSRALGWDTPSPGSSAGALLGPRSFGHTGFTGTSLWIDPDRDLYIVLLANRVHPSRENQRIAPVRRDLADTVVLCLEGKLRRF